MTTGRLPSIEGGIQPTIVDAKGDLIAATAADTVARLAVGTNDQVLIADSSTATGLKWGTPSSGGMTLISTTTLTGTSVTLSSIPATYKDLYIVIKNFLPATNNRALFMRFNADANANRHQFTSTIALTTATAFDLTSGTVISNASNSVSESLATITIPDYTNTTTWKMGIAEAINNDATTTTSFEYFNHKIFYNQTGAISSLQFLPNAGSLTSGTILLYGVL